MKLVTRKRVVNYAHVNKQNVMKLHMYNLPERGRSKGSLLLFKQWGYIEDY